MSEQKRKSLLINPQSPQNTEIWGRLDFLDRSVTPTYNRLKTSPDKLAAAKDTFLSSDRTENPDLRPHHLNEDDLLLDEADWLSFKEDLKARTDLEPIPKQAYLWRVNEEIAQIRMVQAATQGQDRRFLKYNEYIYGTPDPEIFTAAVDWFRADAADKAKNDNPAVRQAAEEVLALLPDMGGNKEEIIPDPEVFAKIREQHLKENGYFALLFAGVQVPDSAKIDKEAGDPILWQALRNLESGYVVADAPAAAWSADHHKEELQRPAKYNMPRNRFLGLPGHELRHILERQNGLRGPEPLFASGLDRYENGNEGRAVMAEQIPYATFEHFSKQLRWQDIMRRYLAAGLGWGAAGEPLNFSQSFKIVNAIDRLWARDKENADPETADAKADNRSWDLLATKTFVGTAGEAGIVYLKNTSYLAGNVACWRTAEERPELIELGDLGKFDITNPRHVAIAQATGLLPNLE